MVTLRLAERLIVSHRIAPFVLHAPFLGTLCSRMGYGRSSDSRRGCYLGNSRGSLSELRPQPARLRSVYQKGQD
jgi:hypothetical protein